MALRVLRVLCLSLASQIKVPPHGELDSRARHPGTLPLRHGACRAASLARGLALADERAQRRGGRRGGGECGGAGREAPPDP
eukprot:6691092-Lingulodinium_polyedra.AAC.1